MLLSLQNRDNIAFFTAFISLHVELFKVSSEVHIQYTIYNIIRTPNSVVVMANILNCATKSIVQFQYINMQNSCH